jgi:hypothetical protein
MEKNFSSIRAFVDVGGKAKFCVSCGNMATQEALFSVDGATYNFNATLSFINNISCELGNIVTANLVSYYSKNIMLRIDSYSIIVLSINNVTT